MFRYYVIATVIVLSVVVLATAWNARDRFTESFQATPPPPTHYDPARTPHGGFEAQPGRGGAPLLGDAPWALSALPDCLIQRSEVTGPLAFVRSKLPEHATVVAPGSILRYGPCTISVRDGEAVVSRGSDMLRIPPRVILYRTEQKLALLRVTGTYGELRVYSQPQTSE